MIWPRASGVPDASAPSTSSRGARSPSRPPTSTAGSPPDALGDAGVDDVRVPILDVSLRPLLGELDHALDVSRPGQVDPHLVQRRLGALVQLPPILRRDRHVPELG